MIADFRMFCSCVAAGRARKRHAALMSVFTRPTGRGYSRAATEESVPFLRLRPQRLEPNVEIAAKKYLEMLVAP